MDCEIKILFFSTILVGIGNFTPQIALSKSALKRPQSREVNASIKDYKSCRKQAVKKPSGERSEAAAACKDQYPGAESYIACKKKAVKASKGSSKKLND